MKFEVRDDIILFLDDCSARYATMFGPAGKLSMRYDASYFNDWERRYAWAFVLPEPARLGQVFTFASADREVSSLYDGAEFRLCEGPAVVRNAAGAPLRLVGASAPNVTILIATMNRRDLLELTLWYIYETSTDEERNIWIWDNASLDDTSDFLGTLQGWPGVRCFRSEENLGLVGARKRMLPHVETPYFFTLDDDMWPLNQGWVSGVSHILQEDSSIYQLSLSIVGHWHNNYGIVHTQLDRPLFRVPYRAPSPRLENRMSQCPEGAEFVSISGETVLVPRTDGRLPIPASGSASAWQTSDVLRLIDRKERHPVADLSEVWGDALQEGSRRVGMVQNYEVVSPCPGPIWHLGRGERYWERRCEIAPAIYNRSSETQRGWLEAARAASGWGSPLENPDVALPRK